MFAARVQSQASTFADGSRGEWAQLHSMKQRALAPALSSEHLRYAQSLPASKTTTGSSSFLTPILPGPRSMSPPPRQEADNYFDVHGYNSDDKKHHKKNGRRNHKGVEDVEASRSIHRSQAAGPRALSSIDTDCELCAAGTHGSTFDSTFDATLVKNREALSRTKTHDLEPLMEGYAATRVPKCPQSSSSMLEIDDIESPAANALRRLSQPQPVGVGSEARTLRRMSSAIANTLNFLKSRTPTSDSNISGRSVSQKSKGISRRSAHKKSLTYRPLLQESKDPHDLLGTPTSITLRKASNVYVPSLARSSMSASLSHEDEYLRSADAPKSELLAFYSTSPDGIRGSASSVFPSPSAITSPLTLTGETSPKLKHHPYDKKFPPTVHFPRYRRHSVLASNALTFTDVHIAPGTFLVDPKSRRQSLAVAELLPRRISVVRFRSRNSVHEIIWREDETTSDSSLASSSCTSTSPQRNMQSLQSGEPSPKAEGGPTQKPAVINNYDHIPSVAVSSSMIEKPQVGLFQWSWGKPAASSSTAAEAAEARNERKNNRPNLQRMTSASNSDFTRLRRPSGQYAVEAQKRSISDILSFPPLRERSSTLEWRRAPLVDLNDPLAGQGQCFQTQENDEIGILGLNKFGNPDDPDRAGGGGLELASENVAGTPRRLSSHPHAPARLGPSGRVGSRFGTSSHVRFLHGYKF